MRFDHLQVPDQWNQYFSKYPQGYTIVEALMNWVGQVDIMTDNLNHWNDYLDDFVKTFEAELQEKVIDTLQDWQADGTLDIIIDQALQTQIDGVQTQVTAASNRITTTEKDLYSRGVNALYPPAPYVGAKGDGIVDDGAAINNLLVAFDLVLLPPNTYRTTTTIYVGGSGKALIGMTPSAREYGKTAIINYDGAVNNHKAVVLLGVNEVDAEPATAGSDNVIENIQIDANYKAGFCLYGTYLTNETKIKNVTTQEALEYNVYLARGWYASIKDIVSRGSKGKGIAISMPLEYLDGTAINWVTSAPLEMNNVEIDNLRSWDDGRNFSVDFQNTYNPAVANIRRKAYGVGIGLGNSMNVERVTVEQCGGTCLYVYTDSQPVKSIRDVYIEQTCKNSGLFYSSTATGIIIEHLSGSGGTYEIKNVFSSYTNGGGIMFVGDTAKRKVWLKNVHQPRFITSGSGLSEVDLFSMVLKNNVAFYCGYSNSLPSLGKLNIESAVNTRYTWEILTNPSTMGSKLLMVKGTNPQGSISVEKQDGTITSYSFPAGMDAINFVSVALIGDAKRVYRSGTAGTVDATITFRVIDMPATYES